MSDHPEITLEIAGIYIGLMETLDGASLPAARSALAMATLMTGENAGLTGDDLVEWIDQTCNEARVALGRPPHPRH